MQKIRRCREDRWDFTHKDGNQFPVVIEQGGTQFSFCPGKVTWDRETQSLFEMLVVSFETGALYTYGGIAEQPAWFIELLSWFVQYYDTHKFASRARMVLGSPKAGALTNGTNKRQANNHTRSR